MRTAWLALLLVSSCCRLSDGQIRLLPEYAAGQPIVAEATFNDAPENATAHVLWSVGGEAGYLPVSATKIAVWPRYRLKTQELSVRCSGFLTTAGSDGQEILVKDSFREWQASTVILGVGENPQPKPEPPAPAPDTPAPIPADGLRVLIVYESKDLPKMAKEQQAILFDKDVREFLGQSCVKVGGVPEWRIIDQNVQVYDQKLWKDAIDRPRKSVPWVVVSNGKTGIECELPANKAAFQELVRRFAK